MTPGEIKTAFSLIYKDLFPKSDDIARLKAQLEFNTNLDQGNFVSCQKILLEMEGHCDAQIVTNSQSSDTTNQSQSTFFAAAYGGHDFPNYMEERRGKLNTIKITLSHAKESLFLCFADQFPINTFLSPNSGAVNRDILKAIWPYLSSESIQESSHQSSISKVPLY